MFPHVNSEDRDALYIDHTMHQRVVLVVGLCDQESAVGADTEPDPAGIDAAHNRLFKGLFEAFKVSEILCD